MASLPAGATAAAEANLKSEARTTPNTHTTMSEKQPRVFFLLRPPPCIATKLQYIIWLCTQEPAILLNLVLNRPGTNEIHLGTCLVV